MPPAIAARTHDAIGVAVNATARTCMILHFEGKLLQSSGQDGWDRNRRYHRREEPVVTMLCFADPVPVCSPTCEDTTRTPLAHPSHSPLLPGMCPWWLDCFRGCVAGPFRTVCAHREVLAYDRRVAFPEREGLAKIHGRAHQRSYSGDADQKPGRNVYRIHLPRANRVCPLGCYG
jgi:hypothetical protein